jgi:hypothetical protein
MNIIETKTLLTSKFLEFKETYYEAVTGGKINRWSWVQRPNNTSAVVIAATAGDNLVLIKEYRVPLGGLLIVIRKSGLF